MTYEHLSDHEKRDDDDDDKPEQESHVRTHTQFGGVEDPILNLCSAGGCDKLVAWRGNSDLELGEVHFVGGR